MLLLVALLACSSEPPAPASVAASVAAPEAAPAAPGAPDGRRIGDPPPPLGAAGRALEVIATAHGVGLARCPVPAVGAVPRVWGTGRDVLRDLGPTWLLDLEVREEAPWDPVYDVGFVEDGWVTLLAAPGTTGGLLRPDTRTLALTWPAAVAGEVVACTAVETWAPRVVEGTAEPRSVLVGCSEPTSVEEDGSFRLEAPTPCTLWAEARGRRSAPLVVQPGDPLRVDLALADDPSWADADLTSEGRARLAALLDREADRVRLDLTALDGLVEQADKSTSRQLGRWRIEQRAWLSDVQRIRALLP